MDAWMIAGLWILWTLYWYVAARDAKPVLRSEGPFARLLHTAPYLAGFALLAVPALGWGWLFRRVLPANDEIRHFAVALVLCGLGFATWARMHLAGNWSNLVVLRRDHEFITSGPYRLVRHPIYSGILLAVVGTAIARGDVRGLVAVGLIGAVIADQIAAEERLLAATFGPAYRAYRLAVPALLPRLGASELGEKPSKIG